MAFEFRVATIDDAQVISQIKADTWRQSFTGIVNQATLDRITSDTYLEGIANRLPDPDSTTIVAATEQRVVAFCTLCRSRFDSDTAVGEVHSLFVAPGFQKSGCGSELLNLALARLEDRKFSSAVVWTFSKNHGAIRYYEKSGAVQFRTKVTTIDGHDYEETCLKWDSDAISALTAT